VARDDDESLPLFLLECEEVGIVKETLEGVQDPPCC